MLLKQSSLNQGKFDVKKEGVLKKLDKALYEEKCLFSKAKENLLEIKMAEIKEKNEYLIYFNKIVSSINCFSRWISRTWMKLNLWRLILEGLAKKSSL